MYDLISIGGICMDLYFKGKSLTYKDNRFQLAIGGKYLVDEIHYSVGGGGANVAIAASQSGIKAAVYGVIADNQFKHIIFDQLKEKNVNFSLCPVDIRYNNISSILLNENGERTIINYVSPHIHLFESDDEIRKLLNTRYLFLGNLPDVSFTSRLHLLTNAKKINITTVLNFGIKDCRRPKEQLKEMLLKTDILICNGHEFAEIVKAPYNDISFKEDIIKHYSPFLSDKIIVVTEGDKGSYCYYKGMVLHEKAIPISKIVDTTGAGDGYTGAFIAEYSKSKMISKAMQKASQFASKVLCKIGAN